MHVRVCLCVCISCTGGSFPFTVGRIQHGHKVRPDLCAIDNNCNPRKYLGSFYTDSLVHDPLALKMLLEVIGKVMLILCLFHNRALGMNTLFCSLCLMAHWSAWLIQAMNGSKHKASQSPWIPCVVSSIRTKWCWVQIIPSPWGNWSLVLWSNRWMN